MAWSDVIEATERRLDFVLSVAVDLTALEVRQAFTTLSQVDTLVIATWNHGGAADPYEPHQQELDGMQIIARPEDEESWNINGHFPGEAHHPGCTCYWSTVTVDMENVGLNLNQFITSGVTGPRSGFVSADGQITVDQIAGPDAFIGPGADAGATPSPFSSSKPWPNNSDIDIISAFDDFIGEEFGNILGDGRIWSDSVAKAFERAL